MKNSFCDKVLSYVLCYPRPTDFVRKLTPMLRSIVPFLLCAQCIIVDSLPSNGRVDELYKTVLQRPFIEGKLAIEG